MLDSRLFLVVLTSCALVTVLATVDSFHSSATQGCTDPEACNYDPLATENQGCYYPQTGFDCLGCIGDIDANGSCGCQSFEIEPIQVGDTIGIAQQIQLGDLDGDAKPDVVLSSSVYDEIRWHQSVGDSFVFGGFVTQDFDLVGDFELVDVEGDEDLDIVAIGEGNGGRIQWYENSGTGSFTEHFIEGNINLASSVATADMSGDGLPDILVGSREANAVLFFENLGAGMFSMGQLLHVSSNDKAHYVHIADLDNDGNQDAVFTSRLDNAWYWCSGNGDGTFQSSSALGSIEKPREIVSGDFNNDGLTDFVIGEQSGTPSSKLELRLGIGGASHSSSTLHTVVGEIYSLEIADVDGDGDEDILFGESLAGDGLYWLNNQDGQGTFSAPILIDFETGGSVSGIAVGDINFDGLTDLAYSFRQGGEWRYAIGACPVYGCTDSSACNYNPNATVEDGSCSTAPDGQPCGITCGPDLDGNGVCGCQLLGIDQLVKIDSIPGSLPTDMILADVDGDQDEDLIVTLHGPDRVEIYENTQGTFSSATVLTSSLVNPTEVVVGDIDNDGDVDIAAAGEGNNGQAWWWANNGDGTWQQNTIGSGFGQAATIQLANLDNDPYLEALVGGRYDDLVVFFDFSVGSGFGTGQALASSTTDTECTVRSADMDGDGDQDIVYAARHENGIFWRENLTGEAGGFAPQALMTSSPAPRKMVLTDVNGDGRIDVFVGEIGSYTYTASTYAARLYLGNGDGTLQTGVILQETEDISSSMYDVGFGDIDSDGDIDLFVGESGGNNAVYMHLNLDGNASFSEPQMLDFLGGGNASSMLVSDVDQDQDKDLVYGYRGGGEIRMLSMGCDGQSGCTDPAALNYDPGVEFDNGTCQYVAPCGDCPVTEVPGYLGGHHSVSDQGTFNYHISLKVPTGTAGVQPEISVAYSNTSGDGVLGLGWNLTGLSAISRAPQILDIEGQALPIQWDQNDRLTLDGDRLLSTNDFGQEDYWGDQTEFRSEFNPMSQIISYKNATQAEPDSFVVKTASGLIMTYGSTEDSRIEAQGRDETMFWALAKVADTKGNYFTYTYDEDPVNGVYRPVRISYTYNDAAGLTAKNFVRFVYEDRPDVRSGYFQGTYFKNSKRLVAIEMIREQTIVRSYAFGYSQAAVSNASLLTSVQECGLNNTCFPATTFEYEEEQDLGFSFESDQDLLTFEYSNPAICSIELDPFIPNDPFQRSAYMHVLDQQESEACELTTNDLAVKGDFNGDGHIDIFRYNVETGSHQLAINDGSFNFTHISSVAGMNAADRAMFPGDYNSDGYIDILARRRSDGNHRIYWGSPSNPLQTYLEGFLNNNDLKLGTDFGLADFDGDGRSDIYWIERRNSSFSEVSSSLAGESRIWLNKSANGVIEFQDCGSSPLPEGSITFGMGDVDQTYGPPQFGPIDINGDGFADFFMRDRGTSNNNNRWYISNGCYGGTLTFTEHTELINSNLINGQASLFTFIELNGDGLPDPIWRNPDTGDIQGWINKGRSDSGAPQFEVIDQSWSSVFGNDGQYFFEDLDSDGDTDVLRIKAATGENTIWRNGNNSTFGSVLQNPLDTAQLVGFKTFFLADINDSGGLDLFAVDEEGSNKWFRAEWTSDSNYLKTVTSGLGMAVSVDYAPMTDPLVYEKGNSASYPTMDFISRTRVVQSIHEDNGLGGTANKSYQYFGATVHLRGRGYRGFDRTEITNETTGIRTTKWFDKDPVYSKAPLIKTEVHLIDGPLLSETTLVNAIDTLFSSNLPSGGTIRAEYSWVFSSTDKVYELDSSLVQTTFTTNPLVDGYGNVREKVVNYGDGFAQQTSQDFYYNGPNSCGFVEGVDDWTDEWIIGRLETAQVTYLVEGEPEVVRYSGFLYDCESGLLIEERIETDESDPSITKIKSYVQDVFGNMVQSVEEGWDGVGNSTRTTDYVYDEEGRFAVEVYNTLGHSSSSTFSELTGLVTSTTDANGLTTYYTYDDLGRILRTDLPDGTWSEVSYSFCDGTCPSVAVMKTTTTSSSGQESVSYVDVLDRVMRTETLGFDGTLVIQDYEFNEKGQQHRQSLPYFEGEPVFWTTTTFDDIGRPVEMELPGGQVSRTIYDGLTTTQVDPLGRTMTSTKNVRGEVVEVVDDNGNSIHYSYDAAGNLTEIRYADDHTISMTYDKLGRKTSMTDPELGTYQYAYNAFGELISQTYPDGHVTTMRYDELGRLLERHETEGVSSWEYDTKPNGLGLLAGATHYNGHALEMEYDALSRNYLQTETISGQDYSTYFTFDEQGRLSTTTYPGTNLEIRNTYNALGYLERVIDAATDSLYWQADSLDAQGRMGQFSLGNGIVTRQTFDAENGWLDAISSNHVLTGDTIQRLAFAYNAVGNLIERHDLHRSLSETFAYDNLNRMVQAAVGGQTPLDMAYDYLGNITHKSDVGDYSYEDSDRPHRLTSIEATGIVGCIPTAETQFTYTSFNKVSDVGKGQDSLHIDFGISRSRIVQEQWHADSLLNRKTYLGSLVEILETDSSTVRNCYIRGGSGVIATLRLNEAGESSIGYWHKDHLGSLETITNAIGQPVEYLSYDPWGKRRNEDWTPIRLEEDPLNTTEDRGFTGHEHLETFGIINMNGRMYDPVLGRFIQADPFVQRPEMLQNLNRYSYVLNNPLNLTDPSGFFFASVKRAFNKILDDDGPFGSFSWGLHWAGKGLHELERELNRSETGQAITMTALVVGVAYLAGPAAFGWKSFTGVVVGGFTGGFVGGNLAVANAGGSMSDAFRAGLREGFYGAVKSSVSFGVARAWGAETIAFQKSTLKQAGLALSQGIAQGAISEYRGGSFESGFYSTLGSKTVSYGTRGWNMGASAAAAGFTGGAISQMNGGKFANGAVTSSFVYLFNTATSEKLADQSTVSSTEDDAGHELAVSNPKINGPGKSLGKLGLINNLIFSSNLDGEIEWGAGYTFSTENVLSPTLSVQLSNKGFSYGVGGEVLWGVASAEIGHSCTWDFQCTPEFRWNFINLQGKIPLPTTNHNFDSTKAYLKRHGL